MVQKINLGNQVWDQSLIITKITSITKAEVIRTLQHTSTNAKGNARLSICWSPNKLLPNTQSKSNTSNSCCSTTTRTSLNICHKRGNLISGSLLTSFNQNKPEKQGIILSTLSYKWKEDKHTLRWTPPKVLTKEQKTYWSGWHVSSEESYSCKRWEFFTRIYKTHKIFWGLMTLKKRSTTATK